MKLFKLPYDIKLTGNYRFITSNNIYNLRILFYERSTEDSYSLCQGDDNDDHLIKCVDVKNTAIKNLANGKTVVAISSSGTKGKLTRISDAFKSGGTVSNIESTASKKFIEVMRNFGKGKLKDIISNKKVKKKQIAVLIAYLEARKINPKFGKKHKLYVFANENGGKSTVLIKQGDKKNYVNIIVRSKKDSVSGYSKILQNLESFLSPEDTFKAEIQLINFSTKIKYF